MPAAIAAAAPPLAAAAGLGQRHSRSSPKLTYNTALGFSLWQLEPLESKASLRKRSRSPHLSNTEFTVVETRRDE